MTNKLDKKQFIVKSLKESSETKEKIIKKCSDDILKAAELIQEAFLNNKKLMICGNGGSAADAQHIAAEFVVRLSKDFERPGLPAIALTTDTSLLTAAGNDIGFDNVFSRSVEALGKENDVLLIISTSGNSKNVLNAAAESKKKNIKLISLTGGTGGKLIGMCDVNIIIPSDNVQRIQEGHITVAHILCELVERGMYQK